MKICGPYNHKLALSIGACKHFVWLHRNIFDSLTRTYVEYTGTPIPIVIKEISVSPDGKQKSYWYWTFYENYYMVYKFDGVPSKDERSEMVRQWMLSPARIGDDANAIIHEKDNS